ncbi:MAG: hypothetical protein ACKO4Y_01690 [Flavobacteriales bacterium]
MRFYKALLFLILGVSSHAQQFKAILSGETSTENKRVIAGVSIYLIQNQQTLVSSLSDEKGEYLLSASVSKKEPLVIQCSKPGFLTRKVVVDLKDLVLPKKTTEIIIRLSDSINFDLMPLNPMVSFTVGERDYAERLTWKENELKCVTDQVYKKNYSDSLHKRITDEEGRQLIAIFKRKSSEFEQVKNYTMAIQYMDSAAKKATSYQLTDTTIDRTKQRLQTAQTAQLKEIAKQQDIDSLFQAGDSLLALLKWNDAKIPYTAVLKLDPNSLKAQNKLNSIAGLKKEEDDRAKEIATFYKNRRDCNGKVTNNKYKEALIVLQKSSSLTKIPQSFKDGIKVTQDSINVLLGTQKLNEEVNVSVASVRKLVTAKGSLPGFEEAVQKTQRLLSNLTDSKKIAEVNKALDDIIKQATDAEIQAAYSLHSNGKTEYDKAITKYESIKRTMNLMSDVTAKNKAITDVDTRIADAKKNKEADDVKYAKALSVVKDNLDSLTFNPSDKVGYLARLSKVKSALTTEPLKSKAKQADILALNTRFTKVNAYFVDNKKEFPKLELKDSIAALSAATLMLTRASSNELGNIEVKYLKSVIDILNQKIKPIKNTPISSVRGTVVTAPAGATLVSNVSDAKDEMAFTKTTNELKVVAAWDELKESVDRTNLETGKREDERSLNQQLSLAKSADERDVKGVEEAENNINRELVNVAAVDRVGYEINAQNKLNEEAVNQRGTIQDANKDSIDVYVSKQVEQNNASRFANEQYMDQARDTRDVINKDLTEQNLKNVESQQAAVNAFETSKSTQDLAADEQTETAKLAQALKADYIDNRTQEANYLKDEAGNCFTWNKMTELVYKSVNDLGFTTRIITRRIVVNAKGYGVVYEMTTNDQGINSFTLNGQAVPESFWLQHSTGETAFSEGGPITPNCK